MSCSLSCSKSVVHSTSSTGFFSLSRVKIGLHRSDSQNRKFDSVIILSANSYTFFREVGLGIFWMAQI